MQHKLKKELRPFMIIFGYKGLVGAGESNGVGGMGATITEQQYRKELSSSQKEKYKLPLNTWKSVKSH